MKRNKLFEVEVGARTLLAGMAGVSFGFASGIAAFIMLFLLIPFATLGAGALHVGANEEIQALLKGLKDETNVAIGAVKTELTELTKGLISPKEFAEKMEAIGLKDNDTFKKLQDAVDKQGTELTKLLEKGKDVPGQELSKAISERAADIQAIAKAGKGTEKMVSMQISKATVQRSSVTNNTMGFRLPDIGQLAYAGSVIEGSLRHVNITGTDHNGVIRYIDQATVGRNAQWVAETAAKPEGSIIWQEYTMPLETIAEWIPVTKQAFNDLGFIEGELRRLLEVDLSVKIDTDLVTGSGVTPIIKGLYTYATAWVPAAPYQGVTDANIFDLIAAVATKIALGKESKYSANVVYLNPVDIWKYKVLKATDGHYLLPPFVTPDGQNIAGLRVIETSKVAANTMVVGDSRYATIYDLEAYNVSLGWINDQFIKNMFTILAERRLALLVRNADLDAWIKVTDISAALTGLEV